MKRIHGTTVVCVRKDGSVAMGGDGQVTLHDTVLKHDAVKIRRLAGGKVLAGFAGSVADAFALLERFENRLKSAQGNILRAANEVAREWRTDRALRRLESIIVVADHKHSLLLSGTGDVIEPSDGIIAVGSGGNVALGVARALAEHTTMNARRIVEESLKITGRICIYTNEHIHVEELECGN